jgi:hypothetical protein
MLVALRLGQEIGVVRFAGECANFAALGAADDHHVAAAHLGSV